MRLRSSRDAGVSSRREKVDRRLVVILAALIASVVGIVAGFAVAVHVDDTASVGSVPAVRAGPPGVFMAVDPTTPCRFWYTNQYYNTDSAVNWKTVVGAFTMPSCGVGPISRR